MAHASPHVLVIGGQRSGKSRYGERLVTASGRKPVYLATATAGDGEMADRIAIHRDRRDERWITVEEPLELADALRTHAAPDRAVLVECLTLWLNNLYAAERDIEQAAASLVGALEEIPGPTVIVTNEVGAGIIPNSDLARAYADALGTLNQCVAEAVGRVVLVVAGQPLLVKPSNQSEIIL